MLRQKLMIIFAAILLLNGCKIEQPPTSPLRYPGFESALPESIAIIREANGFYLRAVDGVKVEKHLYHRQFEIPSGPHQLTVYAEQPGYNSEGQMEGYSPGLYNIDANLKPGHTYFLGHWQYILRDEKTKQPAPTTMPGAPITIKNQEVLPSQDILAQVPD